MNKIQSILSKLVSDLYKIEIFRVLVVYLRFLILFQILKKHKTLYDENENIKNLITRTDENRRTETTIQKNTRYAKEFVSLRKKYLQFAGGKTLSLLNPIQSLDFVDRTSAKILSIGPRNESELFAIRSLGYNWKNIHAIDLHTYSNLTKLCDMHKMFYEDNTFDVIISGWTLSYSTNKNLAMDEIKRVAKNNAVISVGFTYLVKELRDKFIENDKDYELQTTDQIIDFFKVKQKNIFFNFDSYKINEQYSRASRVIFRIEK
jgi:DNA-directed RNA polymerase subunit F